MQKSIVCVCAQPRAVSNSVAPGPAISHVGIIQQPTGGCMCPYVDRGARDFA